VVGLFVDIYEMVDCFVVVVDDVFVIVEDDDGKMTTIKTVKK
jgi:hypothetical protein